MKIKLITMIVFISLIGIVSAYTIGQIISQQQLDNLDLSQETFNWQWTSSKADMIDSCIKGICYANWSIDTIIINEDSNYEAVRVESNFPVGAKYWKNVREQTNQTYAVQRLKDWLQNKKSSVIEGERERLEILQTQYDVDISGLFNDLNLE